MGVWSTGYVRRGWASWACSAWSGDSFGEGMDLAEAPAALGEVNEEVTQRRRTRDNWHKLREERLSL